MDAFEAARLKYQKNREREAKTLANKIAREAESPEQREVREPQKAVLLTPKQPKTYMTVTVKGPVMDLEFKVHYAGTLLASQQTEPELKRLFKKQLSALGMVE